MSDPIHHPEHYTAGGMETWDVIAEWRLDYFIGNAVKYISRAGRKAGVDAAQDLRKAIAYLDKRMALIRDGYEIVHPNEWVGFAAVHDYSAAKDLDSTIEMALQLIILAANRAQGCPQIAALKHARWFIHNKIKSLEAL